MSFKLVTVNDVLLDIYPKAWNRITSALESGEHLLLGVFPPQETRKSTTTDSWAVELAKMGKNVLMAVNSGDVATEHLERIRKLGGSARLLRSHAATFKGRELECPDYENIQYYYKLGVDSTQYKKTYCKNCPYYEECDYPKQYARAADPDTSIVIMQHAHFRCRETLINLFKNKHFDVLIIDESFIDSLIDIMFPTAYEIEALKSSGFDWALKLATWLEVGGEPKGTIRPLPGDLEELFKTFEGSGQAWRIRELVDAFNRSDWLHVKSGIKSFVPIPFFPVRILTDATATPEELSIVFNTDKIEFIGKGSALNIRAYHPENDIIQVIDSSLAKSSLKKDDKFYDFLNFIGLKCSTTFKNDRVLVTTFKDDDKFNWRQETIEYLKDKFPHLDVGEDPLVNKIVVDGMKVGVNTYANFTVQFLVCSVYMSPYQIAEGAYKIKFIRNWWRQKEDLPIIQNILPQEGQSIEMEMTPVRKIELDGIYEYPDISIMVPSEKFDRMTYEKNIGKSQQAIRIRFTANPEKRKKVYIFGNYNFPSMLITKTVLLDDIIAELNAPIELDPD